MSPEPVDMSLASSASLSSFGAHGGCRQESAQVLIPDPVLFFTDREGSGLGHSSVGEGDIQSLFPYFTPALPFHFCKPVSLWGRWLVPLCRKGFYEGRAEKVTELL